MALTDLLHFLPFAIVGACWLVGKAMSGAKALPNWLIPPTLTLLGLISGAATAAALGGDWRAWLDHSLIGLISGAGAVGLHQAGRALSRQDTRSIESTPLVELPGVADKLAAPVNDLAPLDPHVVDVGTTIPPVLAPKKDKS